jgi:hypothetical protein
VQGQKKLNGRKGRAARFSRGSLRAQTEKGFERKTYRYGVASGRKEGRAERLRGVLDAVRLFGGGGVLSMTRLYDRKRAAEHAAAETR